ncbi:MAG: YihY/virulence factor BrkB family protein [Syntrophales bacterium]
MRVIFKSIFSFFKDDGPLHAGSIAYFFLLSFLPFCLLLVAIFGYFLGENKEFYEFFSARAMRFFPAATDGISRGLTTVVTYREIGVYSLIVYAYFSFLLYNSLEVALHRIFRERTKRAPLISIVMSFLLVGVIAGFILISFAATSVIQILNWMIGDATGLPLGDLVSFLIRFVIPMLLVFVTASVFYALLPVRRIAFRNALRGGLFTAVFLEAARHLFTIYVASVATEFGAIYGPLSSFVIFLLWVYYAACIFLIGAEIVCTRELSTKMF